MNTIFATLCGLLRLVGKPFGWDYQTTSVNICIHLWPWICIAASVVAVVCAVVCGSWLWITACGIYAVLNAAAYYAIVRHYYPGTVDEVFSQCYEDLNAIAGSWHTSYAIVNLLIYVVLMAMLLSFDASLLALLLLA